MSRIVNRNAMLFKLEMKGGANEKLCVSTSISRESPAISVQPQDSWSHISLLVLDRKRHSFSWTFDSSLNSIDRDNLAISVPCDLHF